jgi:hypothetical protein
VNSSSVDVLANMDRPAEAANTVAAPLMKRKSLGGGSMRIPHSTTDSGSSNSRLPARGAAPGSAQGLYLE